MGVVESNKSSAIVRRRLIIRGQVQGVGFRPFVYRLASDLHLSGFVRNDSAGVTIELQGSADLLDRFATRLRSELPPAARIDHVDTKEIAPAEPAEAPGSPAFQILASDSTDPARSAAAHADVTVDLATCADCLAELFDPADRRSGYPFINCTNCGPRYTIVRDVPYDRPLTTMACFTMCPACQAEYDDPANRRFHAQPNACPVCGPTIWLASPQGESQKGTSKQAIEQAAAALLAGKIVAIRGVGGFHLAVRADRDDAVARLRERKGREHKPLGVMVANLAAAAKLIRLTPEAQALMLSPARPIVVARRVDGAPISDGVAAGTDSLGVMLPYTPLHHLLFAELERQAGESALISLVMTSGNISDEPIVAGNDEAIAALGGVADLFLLHNRDIARRIDDSVVEVMSGMGILPMSDASGSPTVQDTGKMPVPPQDTGKMPVPPVRDRPQPASTCLPLRRARGYVPTGLDLPVPVLEPGLAVGGELKNTVAVVRGRGADQPGQVILSEHIGDLKDGRVYRHFQDVIAHLLQITHVKPAWIAHDLHPMYLSTTWARRQNVKLIPVQHHHAHIAGCLAEHGRTGPAIGLAADGVGYGDDGTIWGGEILLADLKSYRRIGWIRPIGLPGGDAAAVRTGRPALAWLFDATNGNIPGRWLDKLIPDRTERDVVLQLLGERINCPASSALGRYFDAAAAILGVGAFNHFEAQAPIALEAAIAPGCDETLPFKISPQDGASTNLSFEIDLRPTVLELIARVDAGEEIARLAAAFHNTIAAALAEAAKLAADRTGVRVVAASGGVFCNRYLTTRLAGLLAADGNLELLTHRQVPTNDGGLALGQAAVAAAHAAQLAGIESPILTQ